MLKLVVISVLWKYIRETTHKKLVKNPNSYICYSMKIRIRKKHVLDENKIKKCMIFYFKNKEKYNKIHTQSSHHYYVRCYSIYS